MNQPLVGSDDAVGHLRRFIWIIPIVWKAPALRVFYALRAIVFTTAERKHARGNYIVAASD